MISSDVQETTLQTFLEVTKAAVESQAQAIQSEIQVILMFFITHIMSYHLDGSQVERDGFASDTQFEQFLDAARDIVDKDQWSPSHGMIDKTWAERNALEEGILWFVDVDVF